MFFAFAYTARPPKSPFISAPLFFSRRRDLCHARWCEQNLFPSAPGLSLALLKTSLADCASPARCVANSFTLSRFGSPLFVPAEIPFPLLLNFCFADLIPPILLFPRRLCVPGANSNVPADLAHDLSLANKAPRNSKSAGSRSVAREGVKFSPRFNRSAIRERSRGFPGNCGEY